MELENLNIPAINQFASLYISQKEPVTSFFHYNINRPDVFERRLEDLTFRDFPREELTECIASYMNGLPKGDKVEESLHKLRGGAVTVVAGQQAGLLTGPLYTIHKIISIIKLARQQEEALNHPVVPVFWIAGEDHDYQEVNHIFLENNGRMEKIGYPERVIEKKMTSDIPFDKAVMKGWINDILQTLGETEHTNDLLFHLNKMVDEEDDIVRFFAHFVMHLFKDTGLLVVDSAYPPLRKLEKSRFHNLIENSEHITNAVLQQQEEIRNHGFSTQLELTKQAANIFVSLKDERELLEREGTMFKAKSSGEAFSSEELLMVLEQKPEAFSNNVVTRPMMQEWLFPTLAFIGGPGEIAYWGELKKAFEHVGLNIPPVVPRLNITLVEREVGKKLEHLDLSLLGVLMEGVSIQRERYWNSIKVPSLEDNIDQLEQLLKERYVSIRNSAEEIGGGLNQIIDKNLSIHLQQFEFLRNRADKALKARHDKTFSDFTKVENSLIPNGGPQERTWNALYFLNKYGVGFIHDLLSLPMEFDGTHKAVYV
ncbi:bacillithiol biosynthesis cysteine-adding enzyme BshC [Rossellomorea aquimaris]|uniref:bacillithiol biosynthesis cysteine-adding enzyme BshC n=1 Tax=Rossellomorea aquimaris TaxID=189382 RepID=UPI001CD75F2D|nr:bacillithiol biosynthesis cysteine-adding enzyme BshC [Rossellomorea aquimaris]MCA1053412.1 bacillithiol biosynthesis cysteine-adding enzyme BshC [Rossellomorea aquimaris]